MSDSHASNTRFPSGLTRRTFLSMSGAVGAAALVPARAYALASPVPGREATEVAVVGGGVAGLVAAQALKSAGVDVVVLEAAHQVGGRLVDDDGAIVSTSPRVSEAHTALLELARQVGVVARRVRDEGDRLVTFAGDRHVAPPGSISGDASADRDVGVGLRRLNLMAAEVDPAAPWAAPNAPERDAVSLGAWMADNLGTDASSSLFTLLTRVVFAAEPSEVSLLHALATIAGAGGAGPLVNATFAPDWPGPKLIDGRSSTDAHDISCRSGRGPARPLVSVPHGTEPVQEVILEGGAGAVTHGLALGLAPSLRARAAVQRVAEDAGHVVVEGDGFGLVARRVIVALPPGAAARVTFDPPLPGDHQGFLRLSGGEVASVSCTYPRAFWGRDGYSDWAAGGGIFTMARGYRSAAGATLVAHACGADTRVWSRWSAAERRRQVLDALSSRFGPLAREPLSYREHDWRAGPSGGAGWSVVAAPGAVTSSVRARTEPHGRVHWAGTERAAAWAGWLEGAVRSGEQAAHEVFAAVRSDRTAAVGVIR